MKMNLAVGNSTSHDPLPSEKTYSLPDFTHNELIAVVEAFETVFREHNFLPSDERNAGAKVAEVLLAHDLVSQQYARYLRSTYHLLNSTPRELRNDDIRGNLRSSRSR